MTTDNTLVQLYPGRPEIDLFLEETKWKQRLRSISVYF